MFAEIKHTLEESTISVECSSPASYLAGWRYSSRSIIHSMAVEIDDMIRISSVARPPIYVFT